MDWRILTAITIFTWGAYGVVLKLAAGRMSPALSMILFLASYAAVVGVYGVSQIEFSRAALLNRANGWPLLAGVLCAVGAIAFFTALPSAPGSLVLPLTGLSTLAAAVGCILFLHEPLTLRIAMGMICAGLAIVLLAR